MALSPALKTYSCFIVIIAVIILADVYCRDASYAQNNEWPRLPARDSVPKTQQSTPWPPLGGNHYQSSNVWVRPTNQNSIWRQQSSNQNFNSDYGPKNRQQNSEVSDDELREFSESLLRKDVNNAAQHVTINLQRKTTSRSQRDEAPLPLLSIDQAAFKVPTIEKIMNLHDNYIVETNVNEDYTTQEKQEEDALINLIVNTPVMQHTRNFLIQKGKIGQNVNEFKDILREIWFNMYARGGGRVGSSGFEHIFLAEIKNGQVSGLHNWLYFDEAEKNNRANYLGYMKKLDLGDKGAVLKFHFTYHGIDKPVGSMFVGTSPEFEMSLYTTCFLLRADKICPLKLNGNRLIIRTHTYRYRGKNLVGSAFPDI